jgi:hypothetical protein
MWRISPVSAGASPAVLEKAAGTAAPEVRDL